MPLVSYAYSFFIMFSYSKEVSFILRPFGNVALITVEMVPSKYSNGFITAEIQLIFSSFLLELLKTYVHNLCINEC